MELFHENLLRAAVEVGTVQRFALADFSLGPRTHLPGGCLEGKGVMRRRCDDVRRELGSGIEIGMFQNGMFMEYLAQGMGDLDGMTEWGGTRGSRKEVLLSGLVDELLSDYIDVAKGRLMVPLTISGGPAKVTVTSIRDVGKFVAAALELPSGMWEGNLGMVGTTVTMAEVREILAAETSAPGIEDQGISAKDCDKLVEAFDRDLAEEFSLQAWLGRMVAQMEKAACSGAVGEAIIEGKLNDLCPEVSTTNLKEYLKEVWGSK
jgi:hypothetical protein